MERKAGLSSGKVCRATKLGAIAQLVAHLHGMQGVRGSSPLSSTDNFWKRVGNE
ncbi:MAG: hypothetical protein RJB54_444 [Actinomycetota bacterium]|jgi:hypothetical protein